MFHHKLHRGRSRKRRQIKTFLKALVFIGLFWWFIVYGFWHEDNEILSNNFGEALDRNQIDKSMIKHRSVVGKIVDYPKESYDSIETKNDEIQELPPDEQNMLADFLNKAKNIRGDITSTIKTIVVEKTSSSSSTNGAILGDYAKELDVESVKEIFDVVDKKKLVETMGKAQDLMNKIENKSTQKVEVAVNEIDDNTKDQSEEETENVEEEEAPKPEPPDDEEESTTPFGDYGKPVTLPPDMPENVKKLVDEGWKNHEFNEYVSNLIPLNRTLRDFRTDYCRDMQKVYSRNLPTVSIIMTFHNEAWSTLIRSLESIKNRTPKHLINEIILVDDFSDMKHLKEQLDEYIKINSIIKIIRLQDRKGLICARNIGVDAANSDVLVFLDSHIECSEGWLEPLLDRVLLNETTVAVPVINIINDTTFALEPKENLKHVSLGGFSWALQFRWFHKQLSELKEAQAPVKSPTMAGGLFAISSKFFKHLGKYDPQLDLWGGENLELSFKAWMCGGSIEIVQCSHVGHVFRKKSPYKWRLGVDVTRKNSLRVAKVWMDEYSVFFNYATGFQKTDFGDITDRVKLRKSLKCKDFHWYMRNVYPEMKIPSHGIAYGQIQNLGYGAKNCLVGKADNNSPLTVAACHGIGGNQFWLYDGEISRDNHCVTYDAHILMTQRCKNTSKQLFTYDPNEKQIYINQEHEKKCLTMSKDSKLSAKQCDKALEGQKWKLENLKLKRVKKF